eukprot:TRINITY_DN1077_c0_g1_i4.p1 TRINITY_DN1077_c0_g1~~TRINITY_DN1077_c0_g1_i4.p1  ORF type:complete len:328 (-),score=48.37 TRINITY_DN1077_c0_g1_i4:181-1164(-)
MSASHDPPTFKEKAIEFLSSHVVSDIFPRLANVVSIDSKSKLYDGFLTLIQANVLSAPVWDSQSNGYIGFLDIRDLVSFVVFVYDDQKVTDDSRLEDLIKHGIGQLKMKTTDGVTVSYLCRRHKFVTVKESDTLKEVVKVLCDNSLHRVPIVDETGKVVNIISQSSIVQILGKKCVKAVGDDDSDVPLAQHPHVGSSPVLSVPKHETVINTFRLLEKKNRSGIALVDSTGRLVGTTTGKDLGLFLKNPSLAALNLPIFEHLQKIRSELLQSRTPCIAVFEHDKLSRAVALLAATRVHRVFIVDGEKDYRPVRVLSITDILKFMVKPQ